MKPKKKRNKGINWQSLKNKYMKGDIMNASEFIRRELGDTKGRNGYRDRQINGWKQDKIAHQAIAFEVSEKREVEKIAEIESERVKAIDKAVSLLIYDLGETKNIEDIPKRVQTRIQILEKFQVDEGIPIEGVKRIAMISKTADKVTPEVAEYIDKITRELTESSNPEAPEAP